MESREDANSQTAIPQGEARNYHDLNVREQLAQVAAVLREEGVAVAELTSAQRDELEGGCLYLGDMLELLVPERTGRFYADPLRVYTAESLLDFYPDLWKQAASAAGWTAENLRVTLEGEGWEMTARVSFTAFGKEHEWSYRIDSPKADSAWGRDLLAFAAEYLEGCYLFVPTTEDDIRPYAYLPRSVAERLFHLVR